MIHGIETLILFTKNKKIKKEWDIIIIYVNIDSHTNNNCNIKILEYIYYKQEKCKF